MIEQINAILTDKNLKQVETLGEITKANPELSEAEAKAIFDEALSRLNKYTEIVFERDGEEVTWIPKCLIYMDSLGFMVDESGMYERMKAEGWSSKSFRLQK